MNLEWRRLRAVVFESDDWGLCAWSPDDHAYRVLSDTPAFRTPSGRRYGASTLESVGDVQSLVQTLMEFRGGDGFPPVWQANTVMASPDYARMRPPLFEMEALPLIDPPRAPSRWERPGMWEQVRQASHLGVWWIELHGLHHLPESAWLVALRRGIADARRAHEQQSPICQAVESSGEYDPSEPERVRTRNLQLAVNRFELLVGRRPGSFCRPTTAGTNGSSRRQTAWVSPPSRARGSSSARGSRSSAACSSVTDGRIRREDASTCRRGSHSSHAGPAGFWPGTPSRPLIGWHARPGAVASRQC